MKKQPRLLLVVLVLLAFASVNCSLAQPAINRLRSSSLAARLSELAGRATETPRPRFTPRPTFTPTPNYTATPTNTPTPTITPIPTDTPTPIPTDTPTPTPTPLPTDTPVPTKPPPPTATFTPAPPPTPSYPFRIKEQSSRADPCFHTTYNAIINYVYVTDASGTPLGGYRVVGRHSSGMTYQSPETSWQGFHNALEGGCIKFVNLKVELGPYVDGVWDIYLVDSAGNQVSPVVQLPYSSDPSQWVWDFIWWTQ